MTVEVTSDDADEVNALAEGLAAIRTGLHAAGIGTPGLVVPTDAKPSVREDLIDA